MAKSMDILGQTFGRLTAIKITPDRRGGKVIWEFACSCGQRMSAPASAVKSGKTSSCGCLARDQGRGLSSVSAYNCYRAMLSRCMDERAPDYPRYGGAGVTICERWLIGDGERTGLVCFINDMGDRPSRFHSVDRIDNAKGYSPENCRWATPSEQARNKRNNYFPAGVDAEAVCRAAGVKYSTFRMRVSQGWDVIEALSPNDTRRRS